MSDIAPPAKGEEAQLIRFLEAVDGEGEASKREVSRYWEDSIKQVRGDQWRLKRSPYFLANIIKNQVRRKTSTLTESKPQIQVAAQRDKLSKAADVVYNAAKAIWDKSNTEDSIGRLAQFAMTMGSGFLAPVYDPLVNDVEIVFIDSRRVFVDPGIYSAPDLDKAQYLRIDTILSLAELRTRFPGRGALVKPTDRFSSFGDGRRTTSILSSVLSMMPRPYRPGTATRSGPIPRAEIREYWIKDPQTNTEGKLLFPGGRHIVRSGNVILLDEANPYWDGLWPIEMFEWDMDYDTPWGLDEVQDLRRIQEAVNRLGDAWVQNRLLGSNFRIIADLDALDPDQWEKLDNEAGLIIRKKPQRQFEYQPPVPDDGSMPQTINMLIQLMDLLTGNQGDRGDKSPAQGSSQYEGLQMARQVLIRSVARRLESMLERVGQKLVSRIFQFYTCCDPETECLTKRGWKKYTEILSDDEIYVMDPLTRNGLWSPVLGINVWDYSGDMYQIMGRKIDALVTPNHRWWVHGSESCSNVHPGYGHLRPVETKDLRTWHRFPEGAILSTGFPTMTDSYVELLGWFVTEGHCVVDERLSEDAPSRYRICLDQSYEKNPENCERIRICLSNVGVEWHEYKREFGMVRFMFWGSLARKIYMSFGAKRFTYDFISMLTLPQARLLHDIMVCGDGTKQPSLNGKSNSRNTVFYSSDKELCEQFQMIATLCGYSTRLWDDWQESVPPRATESVLTQMWKVRSSVDVQRPGITWNRLRNKTEIVSYSGKVWCPTTVTGTWVARRNGRVYVTGNSDKILFQQGPSHEWVAYTFERQRLLSDDDGRLRSVDERQAMWRDFKFMVTPFSSLAMTKIQRTMAALQLRSATGFVPSVKRVMSTADMGDADELIREGLEELKTLPPPPPAKGRGGRA